MSVFSKDFTLAYIKEVGEDDVLLTVDGKEIVVELTVENRASLFQAVEEDIYIVPFNLETNELMMNVNDEVIKELFPESELEEMQNASDNIPEEHQ